VSVLEAVGEWPLRVAEGEQRNRESVSRATVDAAGRHRLETSATEPLTATLRLKRSRGRVGPRPYDLRHAFAVHRLTAWYREGADIHARLPWLSAYMGQATHGQSVFPFLYIRDAYMNVSGRIDLH
jgi:integrase